MNQTDYHTDANRGPSNPQNTNSYNQYQWQQQQPKVVTNAAYDHQVTNGDDIQETTRLLSDVFNAAAKGSPVPANPYSSQPYQPSKHSTVPAGSDVSVFQETSLWTPEVWMTDNQKRNENGSVPPYHVDESNDNKRLKFTDWSRSSLMSTSSQLSPMVIEENPSAMASRTASYQISDDVVQMFNSPAVMGLGADHASTNNATMSHRQQVTNRGLHMEVDDHSYEDSAFDDSYAPHDHLMHHPATSPSMNGSQSRPSQPHGANAPFTNVYVNDNNAQTASSLNMPDTAYMYSDHRHPVDDHQHIQSYSPSHAKSAVTARQANVFPYGSQYSVSNDLDEQQKKRRRESYSNLAMQMEGSNSNSSSLIPDEIQSVESPAIPKRFRINHQAANPSLNPSVQFGGGINSLYGNTMDGSNSDMSPYRMQPSATTPTLEQKYVASSPQQMPASKARPPHIKLVVKPPKPKAEDLEDDDFAEMHVTETTVRQTTSGKPLATEQAINQCSFVTDKTMLDTISVRKCNYLLNQIVSAGCCLPFVLPVPKFLTLYHNVIKVPSDLMTVEKKLWNSGYSSTDEFHHDVALIWRNAEHFHKNGGDIADKAQLLKQVYFDALQQLDSESSGLQWNTDSRLIAAEEQHFDANNSAQLETDNKTVLYVMRGVDIGEKPRVRNFNTMAEIFDILNAHFYDTIKAMKDYEDGGDVDPNQLPLPRLYISKNRTMLEFAASDPKAVLTILINVSVQKCTEPQKKGLFHVRADAVHVHPLGNRHDLDQLQWPEKIAQAEYAPRAWIKVKILKIVRGFEIDVSDRMEKEIFKRLYTTTRLAYDPRESPLHNQMAKVFVKSAIGSPLGPEDAIDYESAEARTVPEKLPKVGVPITSAASTALAAPKIEPARPELPSLAATTEEKMDVDVSLSEPEGSFSEKANAPAGQSVDQPAETLTNDDENVQEDDIEDGDEEDDQDQGYDYDDEGSYSKGGEDEPSQNATSASQSQSRTPVRQEEAITFMRVIDNENEAAEKDDKQLEDEAMRAVYRERSKAIWDKLVSMCGDNNIDVINVKKYTENVSTFPNAEGYFKQVYYVSNDPTVVVQTFRHMTMYQRITELVCLLKLRNKRHIGQMVEVLKEDEGEVIGLSMVRYQQTLKKYAHVHSHHRLSAHQKYHVIWQMLLSMKSIHDVGLAHRDLSEVNIMVNEMPDEVLEDGTLRPELFLIDFGKAIFCEPEDVRQWWCEIPRMEGDYDGDVVPETREEMEAWCEALPWVKGKPDHGYKMYRSIQTLPKTRSDSDVLPYMIHPQKEDMYSIGVIIWKTFAETEPWEGVLDTDIKGLRYMVEDDFRIEKSVNKDVPGEFSRKLLFSCLKTSPHERQTAAEILEWFEQPEVKTKLIEEWTLYAPEKRANRRAKRMDERENSGESVASHARGRGRGRPSSRAGRGRPIRGNQRAPRGRGRPKGRVGRPPKKATHEAYERSVADSGTATSREASEVPGTREASIATEASETSEYTAASSTTAEQAPKRPGRPRKYPIKPEQEQKKSGRPVGRPRKYPLPSEVSQAQDSIQQQQPLSYTMPMYQQQQQQQQQQQTQFANQAPSLSSPSGYGDNGVPYVPSEWRDQFRPWPPE